MARGKVEALLTFEEKGEERVLILDLPYREGDPKRITKRLGLVLGDEITKKGLQIEVPPDYGINGFVIEVDTNAPHGGIKLFDKIFPRLLKARAKVASSKKNWEIVPISRRDLRRLRRLVAASAT